MLSQPSPDLKAKLLQIEEQLQLAMQEYPERIAIDRLSSRSRSPSSCATRSISTPRWNKASPER